MSKAGITRTNFELDVTEDIRGQTHFFFFLQTYLENWYVVNIWNQNLLKGWGKMVSPTAVK